MTKPKASKSNEEAKSVREIEFGKVSGKKIKEETRKENKKERSLAAKERKRTKRRKKLKQVAPYLKTLAKSVSGKKGGSSKSGDKSTLTDYQLAQTQMQKAILS
jgi:hypothetical protein